MATPSPYTRRERAARAARYYLQAIERALSGEKNPDLVPNTLEKDINLEHVLPQNYKIKEWPTFDEESAVANTKRIGNLTLLKTDENNLGGNRPFSAKKPGYAKSKLKLTKSIAAEKDWLPVAIARRQANLAKTAIVTWPLKP